MLLSLHLHSQTPEHLTIALKYDQSQEISRNSSPVIDMFLKSVNLQPGNPYCAAFVSYCLTEAAADDPSTRSGLARSFITKKSIPASKVLRGEVIIPEGTIVIWQQGNTLFGHTGFTTLSWSGPEGYTIEANTSSGENGNQRDGEGVYQRRRKITPGAAFRITYFTLVKYQQ